jgi:hypothetical protein
MGCIRGIRLNEVVRCGNRDENEMVDGRGSGGCSYAEEPI